MARTGLNAVMVVLFAGCLACGTAGRAPRDTVSWNQDRGAVWIYAELSDLPAELRLDVLDVAVETESGELIPVPRTGVDRGPLSRTTTAWLVAAGPVPPGQYAALHLTIDSATLDRPTMTVELAVPEKKVRLPVSFSVRSPRVSLLRFGHRGDVLTTGGGEFPARFDAWPGELPAAGRLEALVQADPPAVVLVDRLRREVVGGILSARRLTSVAIDLERLRVYVTAPDTDEILAYSIPEGDLVARAWAAAGDRPSDIALTPDGAVLVVGYRGSSTLGFLEPERLTERGRVRSGDSIESIRLAPTGRTVFTFDPLSDRVFAVDVERRSVTAAIQVEARPFTGRFDVDGRRLYVIHRHSPNVAVIDAERLTLENSVFVGHGISAVTVDPGTDRVLFASGNPGTLEIFEPTDLLPADRRTLGIEVLDLRVDAETGWIWVLPEEGNRVRLYERGSSRADLVLELPGRPIGFSTRDRR